jgi:YHS domain-containing protein
VVTDPVCKMDVDEDTAEHKTEHEGKTYYFCAAGCRTAFEEDPGKYLGEESSPTETHEMSHSHPSEKKPWWKFW